MHTKHFLLIQCTEFQDREYLSSPVDARLKEFYCNSRMIKDKNCFGKHKL